MTDPYTRQEIVKIAMLLQESKANTQTAMLLRYTLPQLGESTHQSN